MLRLILGFDVTFLCLERCESMLKKKAISIIHREQLFSSTYFRKAVRVKNDFSTQHYAKTNYNLNNNAKYGL